MTWNVVLILIFILENVFINVDQKISEKRAFTNFGETKYNRNRRNVMINQRLKWTFPIYYVVDRSISKIKVMKALYGIEKETCVRFKQVKTKIPGISTLRYYKGPDCSSFLGKNENQPWNNISIFADCNTVGGIQHETLHALGIDHEHSRYDRDYYLRMHFNNMFPAARESFEKASYVNSTTYGLSYDYGSLMHYGTKYYTRNGKDVMVPKDRLYRETIGSLERLSFLDIKTINLHYCRSTCFNRLVCDNWSYQDPNNCRCKCVYGYTGPLCNKFQYATNLCGQTLFVATKMARALRKTGKKNCVYHIKAPENNRVLLKIVSSKVYPNDFEYCHYSNSLEVKFWVDKSATGARFCGNDRNISITSKDNHIMVIFRSTWNKNKFNIVYKSI
uniref:Metalloendopeptidase n=1 Tax=Strongyloides papillosus TaxID=174720 RepID=A0A0N5C3C7_STREA